MRTKATAVKSRRNRDLTVKRTSNPTSRYWIPCVGLSSLAVLVISYIQLYSSPYLSDSHFEILNLEDSLVGEGPCKYHGNCPAGSVCAVGGTCRPYWNEKLPKLSQAPTTSLEAISDLKMKDCLMSCLKELSVEEEEQYGSVPVVGATYKAASPHHGCVLDFQRSTTSAGKIGSMESRPPDEEFRLAQRFRSVMRVDYVQSSFPNNKSNNNNPKPSFNDTAATSWRAFCHSPCEKDSDCPSNYECRGRTMYRPPNKETAVVFANRCQPKLPPLRRGEKNDDSMIVVTGANSGYFHGLSNFATSLYYWEPHRKMVVYNLGMSEAQLKEVEKYPNLLTLKWRDGFPSSFPPHISGNLKNYAWKSLAINESVHEHDSIFWFDGGGTIVGPLDPIEEIIQLHGVFLVKGQDADMERLTHPGKFRRRRPIKGTYNDYVRHSNLDCSILVLHSHVLFLVRLVFLLRLQQRELSRRSKLRR